MCVCAQRLALGDFIKNSCVRELLSEPSLPDQGLCCQPSSRSGSRLESGGREGTIRKAARGRGYKKLTSMMRTPAMTAVTKAEAKTSCFRAFPTYFRSPIGDVHDVVNVASMAFTAIF